MRSPGVSGTRTIRIVVALLAAIPAACGASATDRERALERTVEALSGRIARLEKAAESAAPTKSTTRAARVDRASRSRPGPAVPGFDVYTARKGVTFTRADEKYQIHVFGRVQPQYQHQNFSTRGVEDQGTFMIRRMKIYSDGYLGDKDTTFQLQLETCATQGTDRTRLDAAYIQQRFTDALRIRFGQFKPPFSWQFMNSIGMFSFVDWSLAARVFACTSPGAVTAPASDFASLPTHGIGWNLGLQVFGDIGKTPFLRYYTGLYNGAGQNIRNENTGLMSVSRIEVHPFGVVSFLEGALPRPRKPLIAFSYDFAADYRTERCDITGDGLLGRADRENRWISGAAYNFKWRRVSSQAEYFRQWTEPANPRLPCVGSNGWYCQASYLLAPDNWEFNVRDSVVDPDRARGRDRLRETGVCLGYYFDGHEEKLQVDAMHLSDEANPRNDQNRARIQYQFTY